MMIDMTVKEPHNYWVIKSQQFALMRFYVAVITSKLNCVSWIIAIFDAVFFLNICCHRSQLIVPSSVSFNTHVLIIIIAITYYYSHLCCGHNYHCEKILEFFFVWLACSVFSKLHLYSFIFQLFS